MKRISILVLILSACFVSVAWGQQPVGRAARTPSFPPNVNPFTPHFPHQPSVPQIPHVHMGPPILPASATGVSRAPCEPGPPAGTVCGYVPVPLDRKHPEQEIIPIYFELYTHSGSRLESAILVNFGGPGDGTTANRTFALSVFGSNLDLHDLLLVDDRGRGYSGTIVCAGLQYGTLKFNDAVAACAKQLGNAASRYGTGDIGQDTEAVRAAFGYDKVDYYGGSYGGADVTAYATRFGDHLRSIVLDAPLGTPGLNESRFVLEKYRTHAEPIMVSLDCQRSPTCSPDHPTPKAELDALVSTIRLGPVEGYAHDANGKRVHVRIDEDALLNDLIDNPTGNFTSTGELLAAARSLSQQSDSQPLLRLGAENYLQLDGANYGVPTVFSIGAQVATGCVDMHEPWDWSESVSKRTAQFEAAVSALPPTYFAPFSTEAPTDLLFDFFGRRCLYWEKPTPSSPVAPSQATYPLAPTLVLSGDLDNRVPFEEAAKVAALFPNSTLVPVAEAGHETVLWGQCGAKLASGFIENLQVGDTSCAKTPETVWPAVGRFPLLAKFARPADVDPKGHNQIGLAERKVVTVSVATATDAMQRSIIDYYTTGNGYGVGLRAGNFQTGYGSNAWTTTLTDCAFAKDVTVNGTVTWGNDKSFVADLKVSGSGTAGGTLHVEGTWQAPGPVGKLKVGGTLGDKQVAVLVPEA
jgi:pimeloyl-ACP methyl ester carboxylesterase